MPRGSNRSDLSGQVFGKLTVESYSGSTPKTYQSLWRCVCECGNALIVMGWSLKSGNTQSCGCVQKQRASEAALVHGHAKDNQHTPEYVSWKSMKQRVLNPNNPAYPDYGGRGITICEPWMDFEVFYADMGDRPKGTSINRIKNDGNYEPSNCNWATKQEQNNNQRPRRRRTA